jgi:hypothetical protein
MCHSFVVFFCLDYKYEIVPVYLIFDHSFQCAILPLFGLLYCKCVLYQVCVVQIFNFVCSSLRLVYAPYNRL